MKTNLLNVAIAWAAELHAGQKDKAGEPYILHPLRVMLQMKTEAGRVVAVLHDVMEDCGVRPEDIVAKVFPDRIVKALECLTKRPEEEGDYGAFIKRIRRGPALAIAAEIAHLSDNSDLSRIPDPTEQDSCRVMKYLGFRRILIEELERRGVKIENLMKTSM